MKFPLLLVPLLLVASAAQAQEAAAALDLSLPKQAALASTETAYPADPPGTFYGDKTGRPVTEYIRRQGCPVPLDSDNHSGVSGSFTTGIGYSKNWGSSTYNAAQLNYCKDFVSDEGNSRTFNMNIQVEQYDGPDGYRGRDARMGPPPMGMSPLR